MSALIICLPDIKRDWLKLLARSRKHSATKSIDQMTTAALAKFDVRTRFEAWTARWAVKAKCRLTLLAKTGGEELPLRTRLQDTTSIRRKTEGRQPR